MLPMNFNDTLEAFNTPLLAYVLDIAGRYEGGVWVLDAPVRRPGKLKAIILQLDKMSLAFHNEGNVSAGGIAVITQESLTTSNILDGIAVDVQSVVVYQGLSFRVVGQGFISQYGGLLGNANFKCYHCLRWVFDQAALENFPTLDPAGAGFGKRGVAL